MKTAKQIINSLTIHNNMETGCEGCAYNDNKGAYYVSCYDRLFEDVAELAVRAAKQDGVIVGEDLKARAIKLAAEVISRPNVNGVDVSINDGQAVITWIEDGIDCQTRIYEQIKE